MILPFSKYINENFGAITINYPPSHSHPSIQDDSMFRPNLIGGAYGGNYRIPRHWNDAPFISGSYGGSGFGHFGSAPSFDYESNEDIKKAYYHYHSMLDNIRNMIIKNNSNSNKAIADYNNEIEKMSKANQTKPGSATWYEDSLEGEPLTFETDTISEPTPGTSGTYYDPPEDGDSGEYLIQLEYDKDNIETLNKLGIKKSSIEDVTKLDLTDLLEYVANAYSDSEIGNIAKTLLNEILYKHLENLEEDFFQGSITTDGEITESLTSYKDYLALKYIFQIGLTQYTSNVELIKEKQKIIKEISKIPNRKYYEIKKEIDKIKGAISVHLDFKIK